MLWLISILNVVPGSCLLIIYNYLHVLTPNSQSFPCFPCLSNGFLGGSVVKNPPVNERDVGLIPGSRRSPREGNGIPLQYSCQGNSMDRRAWGLQYLGFQTVKPDLACTHTHTHTHTVYSLSIRTCIKFALIWLGYVSLPSSLSHGRSPFSTVYPFIVKTWNRGSYWNGFPLDCEFLIKWSPES